MVQLNLGMSSNQPLPCGLSAHCASYKWCIRWDRPGNEARSGDETHVPLSASDVTC